MRQGGAGDSIGPDDIVARFAGYADEVVCLATPALFFAVGQVTATSPRPPTTKVVAFLDRAHRDYERAGTIDAAADPPLRDEEVRSLPVTGGRAPDCPRKTQNWFRTWQWQQPAQLSAIGTLPRGLDRGRVCDAVIRLLKNATNANVFDIELLASRLST